MIKTKRKHKRKIGPSESESESILICLPFTEASSPPFSEPANNMSQKSVIKGWHGRGSARITQPKMMLIPAIQVVIHDK